KPNANLQGVIYVPVSASNSSRTSIIIFVRYRGLRKTLAARQLTLAEGKHRMLRFPHPRRRGIGVRFTAALAVALTISGFGVSSASADANFRKWVAGFRNTAIQSGVTPSTFDLAFKGVTAPDPV